MPRGFNDDEKQAITDSLIEQGRILFSQFGLRKTSINEITKKVGIAPGTFYKFYRSKEELYFEILEKEEEKIRDQWLNVDLNKGTHPKKALKNLLHSMVNQFESNPLIYQLYFENNVESILRKLPREKLVKHFDNDSSALNALIEKWEMQGIFFEENPEIIAGIFRSLFILSLHKKEIGQNVYQKIIERFIDLIVEGLVKKENKSCTK